MALTLGQPLFTDLTFSLEPGDRLGLIAANGRGKSTLLRCLAGQLEADLWRNHPRARAENPRWSIKTCPQSLLAADLPCRPRLPPCPPSKPHTKAGGPRLCWMTLASPKPCATRRLSALSGGWQRTALLARAAITEPDLYLLDEPTNHLDLSRIGILQRWLAALPRDTARDHHQPRPRLP